MFYDQIVRNALDKLHTRVWVQRQSRCAYLCGRASLRAANGPRDALDLTLASRSFTLYAHSASSQSVKLSKWRLIIAGYDRKTMSNNTQCRAN